MKAIVVTDQAAGAAGMTIAERPAPEPAGNDVLVEVHASGFTPRGLSVGERAADRQAALDFGAQEFVDLDTERAEGKTIIRVRR